MLLAGSALSEQFIFFKLNLPVNLGFAWYRINFSIADSKSPVKPVKTPTKTVATTKYGRKVTVKDYSDDDPAWTPGGGSRTGVRTRGGGKPQTYTAKKGRKVRETEVFVISSSDDESEEEVCVLCCQLLLYII